MTAGNVSSTVGKLLILQVVVGILVAAGFYLAGGWHRAISPALGGLAALLPNIYFAFRMYLVKGKEAKKIVRSFYAGESGKILLTALLFYLIFQVPEINLLTLLAGYMAVLSVFWFALLLWRD